MSDREWAKWRVQLEGNPVFTELRSNLAVMREENTQMRKVLEECKNFLLNRQNPEDNKEEHLIKTIKNALGEMK